MKKLIWALLLVMGSAISAVAGSSVWVVTGANGSVTYLGGTCHLLRQSDHPLPKGYALAYQDADVLVFETDLDQLQAPQFQQLLMQRAMYTDGTTLDKVLSAATYNQLNAACAKAGIPLAQLKNFKPFMVYLTLLGLELQKMGVNPQSGVDAFYHAKATTDGKPTQGLESVEAQMNFITTMADGIEDRFIIHGLKDLQRVNQLIEELITTWKTGDETKLQQFFLKDMINDFPKLYKKLVIDRNADWMPQIKSYITTPPKEFILVGVAHLVGPEGVVARLKRQGYKVVKVDR